jgi:hypothetical protein
MKLINLLMGFITIFLLLTFICNALSDKIYNYDVCIVGSGSAELKLAQKLKDLGYVVALQYTNRTAGNCGTVRFTDINDKPGWKDCGAI